MQPLEISGDSQCKLHKGHILSNPTDCHDICFEMFLSQKALEVLRSENPLKMLNIKVSTENFNLMLSKGIRKNFDLTNVLAFVQKWIEIRQDEEDFEVAERFINLCIDLQPGSCPERGDALLSEETFPVLKILMTTVNDRQNSVQDSTVIENIRMKLKELDDKLRAYSSSLTADRNITSSTENDTDWPSSNKDSDMDATDQGKDDKNMDFISKSDTTEVKISSKAESQDKGTAISWHEHFEGSSPLDKFRGRKLEESIEERVAIFLQDQIAYTHSTPEVTFDKFKVTKIKTRSSAKESHVKEHINDTESRNEVKKLNSKTRGLVKTPKSEIKCNYETSLGDTKIEKQNRRSKRRKTTEKQPENLFYRIFPKRQKTMKSFQDFVTNLEDMDDKAITNAEVEPPVDTISHTGDGISSDNANKEQEDIDRFGNVEMNLSGFRKKDNFRSEDKKLHAVADSNSTAFRQENSTVCKKSKKIQPKLGKSGEVNPEYLNIKDEYRDLLLQKNIPDTCVLCKNQFTRGNHLMRHLNHIHKDVETLQCGKCDKHFKDAKLFVTHTRTHFTEVEEKLVEQITDLDEVEYMCKVCSKRFTKVSSIKAHINHHKAVVCKTYKEETEVSQSPDNGIDYSNGNILKYYLCDLCEATFKRRDHLQRHMRCVHSAVNPFSCEICGKTFKLRYILKKHMTTHSSEKSVEKSILCDICGATFMDQACLRRHVKRHSEKRHKCQICNKTYSQQVTLQVHMRKHSGVKPFQCEICSMLFAVKSNMLRHQRRHRGEKRYECDKCGKGFLMAGDLKRHYTTHTGEKNYACKYCGKRFNCRSKIPQHERIHTGEKPYSCRICGKSFIQSGDRKRHEAIHHGKQEETKRRLTLYEIANPDERVEHENRVESRVAKITLIKKSHQVQKNSEIDKQFQSKSYNLDGAVNTIIDYAIKNKDCSKDQYSLGTSGNSFPEKSSTTNESEAFIPGSDMFTLMKSSQNSTDFILQPKTKVTDQDLKVVVVQNTQPSLSYESVEVQNQVFYLPTKQN